MTGTAPLPVAAIPGTVNVCAGAIADGDVGFAADSQPTMMKIATLVVAPIQKRRMIRDSSLTFRDVSSYL